jgi:hypothetical protein
LESWSLELKARLWLLFFFCLVVKAILALIRKRATLGDEDKVIELNETVIFPMIRRADQEQAVVIGILKRVAKTLPIPQQPKPK